MGKLILVSGPNGSGKSVFAERLAVRAAGERCYIATMVPQTADNHLRIERHRKRRAGLGFRTVEVPGALRGVEVPAHAVVLLEDVSNLLANVLFTERGTADAVYADVRDLQDRCALLIAVTISGLAPDGYTGETAGYVAALNVLNARLLDAADAAAHMENGAPHIVKGEIETCF